MNGNPVLPDGWKKVSVSELCALGRGFDLTEATRTPGDVPVYSSSGISYYHNKAAVLPPGLVTGRKGLLGRVFLVLEPFWPHDTTLWAKDFYGNDPAYVAYLLADFHLERLDAATSVPTLNRNNLAGYDIAIPANAAEQACISSVLGDVDSLIDALARLIAKKRTIKQGMMQELLTGRVRLPGFVREWDTMPIGQLASVVKGQQLGRAQLDATGGFAVWNGGVEPSGFTDRPNTTDDVVTVSEGGNSCGWVGHPDGPFWLGGHCYALTPRLRQHSVSFIYHALKSREPELMALRVGSGLPNIQKRRLSDHRVSVPVDGREADAIAQILSDADAEIEALERRLEATRAIKQGMMQELLTGRTRLAGEGAA